MGKVSKRNLDVLLAVDRLAAAAGYPPSIREVGQAVGLSSSTVHVHLRRLQAHGLVAYQPGMARTLQLTEAGRSICTRRVCNDSFYSTLPPPQGDAENSADTVH